MNTVQKKLTVYIKRQIHIQDCGVVSSIALFIYIGIIFHLQFKTTTSYEYSENDDKRCKMVNVTCGRIINVTDLYLYI